MNRIIQELEKELQKKQVDDFDVGDTVDVHVRIIEGEKDRIQVFRGTVIARGGTGINKSFTVRRLVQGEGVERVFPLHAPRVEKVVVARSGRKRRAKLYYLRERVGKATRLREEQGARDTDLADAAEAAVQSQPAAATAAPEKPAE